MLTTPHGDVLTPAIVPVATLAAVKALRSDEIAATGTQLLISNTYHLHLQPGEKIVKAAGGINKFMNWDRPTMTDSGGFQVHSLRPKVDDDGVTFASVYDGAATRLTPETAVEVQGLLGADIQMVLDVCASLPASPDVLRVAVDRTADWAARAEIWRLYMAGSAIGFDDGGIAVHQVLGVLPGADGSSGMPRTRGDWG